jgi:hypothetical protein
MVPTGGADLSATAGKKERKERKGGSLRGGVGPVGQRWEKRGEGLGPKRERGGVEGFFFFLTFSNLNISN